ncbi:hypothetical protein PVL29_026483 [Vitis rotundifolia]|nr:hypothetical protein PVL29_026483 [Vitis rotundifolia]
MGIPHSGRKLIVDKGTVKASQMPSLHDIESMMVDIDDIEEFKRVFLIFACATLLAPTSRLEGSHSLWYTPREQLLGNINWGEFVLEFLIQGIHEHRRKESVWIKGCLMFLQIFYFSISNFPIMYVELTTPRIAAWNDFLVKQRIKLELEMLGGFGKVELVSTSAEQDETGKNKAPTVDDSVNPNETEDFDVICARMEATQRQIIDAQSHLNSLFASYNRDMNVLRTRFTSSYYRTNEGQPSNCHGHVNESGAPFDTNHPQNSPVHFVGQRRSFEDDLGCTYEGVSSSSSTVDAKHIYTRANRSLN